MRFARSFFFGRIHVVVLGRKFRQTLQRGETKERRTKKAKERSTVRNTTVWYWHWTQRISSFIFASMVANCNVSYLGRNFVEGLHGVLSRHGEVSNIGDGPSMRKVIIIDGRSTVIRRRRRRQRRGGRFPHRGGTAHQTTTGRNAERRSRQ